jgi:hypothetical protein
MQLTWSRVILLAACFGALGGCTKKGCNDSWPGAPGVLLVDASTNDPVCGAEVRARDGDYVELLEGADCNGIYSLNSRRDGSYEISATAPGYEPAEGAWVTSTDDCGDPVVQDDGPTADRPGYANLVTIVVDPGP